MKTRINKLKLKKAIFCAVVLALPLVQFCVFYIYINFRAITMAFENAKGEWIWFDNFKTVFADFSDKTWGYALKNSLLRYVLLIVITTPLALLLAFLVYKHSTHRWTNIVRVIFYVPTIMSAIVTSVIYQCFVEDAIPALFNLEMGLLTNPQTKFITIFMYGIWLGFGSTIIIDVNILKGISESEIEAARLEGANFGQEFIYIALPHLFPLWKISFVTGIPTLLTATFSLYEFYGLYATPEISTVGYILFKRPLTESVDKFPEIAALGLLCTIVILPIAFGARYLLNKIDPMEN